MRASGCLSTIAASSRGIGILTQVTKRLAFAIPAVILLAFSFLSIPPSFGQSSGGSLNPADILRSLPPDQRDQILRQIGSVVGGSAGSSNRQGEQNASPNQPAKP